MEIYRMGYLNSKNGESSSATPSAGQRGTCMAVSWSSKPCDLQKAYVQYMVAKNSALSENLASDLTYRRRNMIKTPNSYQTDM